MTEDPQLKSTDGATVIRLRIRLNGIVQGVGFRPFVYRLANESGLTGFVNNDATGVLVEVEGPSQIAREFCDRVVSDAPPLSKIVDCKADEIPTENSDSFVIADSSREDVSATLISPDIAACADCLQELFDPADRRYRYPFINCTNCGPRYTIVEGIPYDRSLTSMKVFPMCAACEKEYHDPADRRFHAQPNACPECGPKLVLHDGKTEVTTDDPIAETINLLRDGMIVAIRGMGGFHLAVDARNSDAIEKLRMNKGRAEKPFALMAPDFDSVRKYCDVNGDEQKALEHYTRPIVLVRRNKNCNLPEVVAPNNKFLGFMLPYSPHHHLLLKGNFDALVMTSANYSEEPIAIGNKEALERMKDIADYFLLHDREILQRCDDSIIMVSRDIPQIVRRARGYVPEPVFLLQETSRHILAVGGELKNTIALSRADQVFLSQHIGDLDNPSAFAFFEHSIDHLAKILEIEPQAVAYDMHPEYLSTKWASKQKLPSLSVQHHHAHFVSVMADNGVTDPTIGIILDGTGYGTDGSIWGGEVLVGDAKDFKRFAWLKSVPMPGGTAAIKQPRRMAVSHLYNAFGSNLFDMELPFLKSLPENDLLVLTQMIDKGINSPMTSSCGRLFDAVSAMLGIRSEVTFEAQAAIELEMMADRSYKPDVPFEAETDSKGALDVSVITKMIVELVSDNKSVAEVAAWFHFALADLFVNSACMARDETGVEKVGLSGGVYQNRLFTKYIVERLTEENFEVLQHRQVPTNDGGLALGQIVIADRQLGLMQN